MLLGRVLGHHGLRGWLKVFSDTEPREGILDYHRWWLRLADGWHEFEVVEGRRQGAGLLARLRGIADREAAAPLLGAAIAVPREDLPDAQGAIYWVDLQGLRVMTRSGVHLGVVDHLFSTGANDVLVVRGERERLLPWVRPEVIVDVDLDNGVLTVDWDPAF